MKYEEIVIEGKMKLLCRELRKRRSICISILLYIISFDLAYIFGVSQLYGYLGVSLNINRAKFVISLIIILLTIFLLPTKLESVSSHLFFILYLITFLPLASYVWLNNKPITYFLEVSFCFILIEVLIKPKIDISIRIGIKRGHQFLLIIFFIYILSTISLIIMNGGIKVRMLDFGMASLSREDNMSGNSVYILNWCAKSLMPLFLAYYGYLKKKKWIFLVCLLQIGLYFSYGFKSFLLSVFYLILVSYTLKKGWRFWKVLPSVFSTLNCIALFLFIFDINSLPLFLFPFRTLALPCEGQFRYYEYFNKFDKLHFGGSLLGRLFGISYPYSERIGLVISKYFTGNVSNSNTGVFSYAYADFGFAGMILAAFVLIIIFRIIDHSTRHIPYYLTVGAMSYQMVCMNDTSLLINLNTGGVVVTMLMLFILDSVFCEKSNSINSKLQPYSIE